MLARGFYSHVRNAALHCLSRIKSAHLFQISFFPSKMPFYRKYYGVNCNFFWSDNLHAKAIDLILFMLSIGIPFNFYKKLPLQCAGWSRFCVLFIDWVQIGYECEPNWYATTTNVKCLQRRLDAWLNRTFSLRISGKTKENIHYAVSVFVYSAHVFSMQYFCNENVTFFFPMWNFRISVKMAVRLMTITMHWMMKHLVQQ